MSSKPYYLSEINFNEKKDIILVGVDTKYHTEIQESLREYGINHYIIPDENVCGFLRRWRVN